MSEVGQKEIKTQERLIQFFQDDLDYSYFGDWSERAGNSNIEENILSQWLRKQGKYSDKEIEKAVDVLKRAARVGGPRSLYEANKEVYGLLRYGIKIKEPGEKSKTVWPIDWKDLLNNYFALAEEVTITGENTKRPDLVAYVNGIALGVLELKRSKVSVSEGIRQNLDNQKKEFIQGFFSTVQFLVAANDTEMMRYGTIGTKEKYYLEWREEGRELVRLEDHIECLFEKERLIDLLHYFILFDKGQKKLPRYKQYFAVKKAQKSLLNKNGGIIWHTQGSGKSLTMVWLAKWILENIPESRVLISTDREELDSQIEEVFHGVDEKIYRTKSGADLIDKLNKDGETLLCSLIHKFGTSSEDDQDLYLKELEASLPKDFRAKGNLFVFIDEAHRTQSGKLHRSMKAILPDATLLGFTGTPLLKKDKATSREIFGDYIDTYKYDEAVRDGVVLDLKYEARDIEQDLSSPDKVDQWFDVKTEGMTDSAKAQLKKSWGKMQQIYSADDRLQKIVNDILMDMETKDRLKSGQGNAMLVAGSIYEACRFYEKFQKTDLRDKCAIITSYDPHPSSIKGEESGEGQTQKLEQYEIYRKMLADFFDLPEKEAVGKIKEFEKKVKERFREQPEQMKLLIVVDKLLTGFDAPSATYLYIDKPMKDHALFQAICRVNRLDGDDKPYGHIVDYQDLFQSLEESVGDYTAGAFDDFDEKDVQGILGDSIKDSKGDLEDALEAIRSLCDQIKTKTTEEYLRFFCSDPSLKRTIQDNESRRQSLYKTVANLIRAYSAIAANMTKAGYSPEKIASIKKEVQHYEDVRSEVKIASGDYVDLKLYEPAMRHLIDTYVRAEDSSVLSELGDKTLVELLVEKGEAAIDDLPEAISSSQGSVAETIDNNVRRAIVKQQPTNPKYFEDMSKILEDIIERRNQKALEYKEYLKEIAALADKIQNPSEEDYPPELKNNAQRVLYDNLGGDKDLALIVDRAILSSRRDGWRDNRVKTREVRKAVKDALGGDGALAQQIIEIAQQQNEY